MQEEAMDRDDGDRDRSEAGSPLDAQPGVGWAGDDRGDVPGWVLITLMTAGLVVALWAVAGPALSNLFESSIASVTGPP